ncbi:GPI ethanolamine phosphate transferase 3-like [Rhipicephalus sanguineus]|uniref:GPI ethanolamine phosphate transferase 3-like n=1 Tax=Rhipicephalus sanguineus TaxID=34632 RepID=UPI0020C1EFFF|nr:GPI ethanolamine phosphate transferase 3-like [Rhipicephalus sanguineus]
MMYRSVLLTVALGIAVCGVCLFCCGFLLQRQAIEEHSKCADIAVFYRSTSKSTAALPSSRCWYPAKFKKAVILLIDALKLEFAQYGPPWDENEHYRNKMPVFSELSASTGAERSVLLKFVADAPTTTVQRLKALMTGGLPTFIDAGTNFYQTEVREDNLINQMFKMGKKVVFMGDDAWVNLFPGKFARAYAYPSFVVKVTYWQFYALAISAVNFELLPNTAMLVSIALALLGWAMPRSPMGNVSLLPASALLFLLTLAGESYVVPLCLMVAALWGLSHLWSSLPPTDMWGPLLCWLLVGQLGFFSTGHQTSFSTIHWKAAFVGAPIDQPPMTLGAVKVLLNTFAGPLVAGASLPLMQGSFRTQGMSSPRKEIMPFVAYCTLLLLQVCSTMASCLLLRRHLMVWAIFAPRLVFQVLSAFFSIVAVFIGWMSSRRIVSRAEVFHID